MIGTNGLAGVAVNPYGADVHQLFNETLDQLTEGLSCNSWHFVKMALLFDMIVDLPEGITVVPVFAADKAEALGAGKELFPGHRVTVVLKEGEPGS